MKEMSFRIELCVYLFTFAVVDKRTLETACGFFTILNA